MGCPCHQHHHLNCELAHLQLCHLAPVVGCHCSHSHLLIHQEHCLCHSSGKIMISTLMDAHAFDTQLMTSFRVSCFRLPIFVVARSNFIHAIQLSHLLCSNGLFTCLSISCTIEVQPPEMITKVAFTSYNLPTLFWDMRLVAVYYQ